MIFRLVMTTFFALLALPIGAQTRMDLGGNRVFGTLPIARGGTGYTGTLEGLRTYLGIGSGGAAASLVDGVGTLTWNSGETLWEMGTGSGEGLSVDGIVSATSFTGSGAGLTGLTKGQVGLGNVDNTSDAGKPMSTATSAALDLKANLAGPLFTGDARAVTAGAGDNDTSLATTAWVQSRMPVVSLRAYGAAGDGVTNDYTAYKAWVDAITALGGNCIGYIAPGTYLIDRHIGDGAGVVQTTIDFNGLSNFRIWGYGAKIKMGSAYTRTWSTVEPLSPFFFDGCSNFSVEGVEIDGDVDSMLQPAGTTQGSLPPDFANSANDKAFAWFKEPSSAVIWMRLAGASSAAAWSAGATVNVGDLRSADSSDWQVVATLGEATTGALIYTKSSRDYTFRDVYAHHGPTDGFYLGGSSSPDYNASLINCRARFNARTGLVIAQLRGAVVAGGDYSYQGFTGGTDAVMTDTSSTTPGVSHISAYGMHSYSGGIDVEPTSANDTNGRKARDIVFTGVTIRQNLGTQYICGTAPYAENIHFIGGTIDATGMGILNTVKLYITNGSIRDSLIVANQVVPGLSSYNYTSTLIDNCRIRSDHNGVIMMTGSSGCRMVVQNSVLEGTHTATMAQRMPRIDDTGAVFRNNLVIYPDAAGAGSNIEAADVLNCLSEGNTWTTPRTSSAYFYIDYGTGTRVEKDLFPSAYCLPYSGSAWTASVPYTINGGRRIGWGTAAPVAGAWLVGDTIHNTAPAASGYMGWTCTTAGSPGTWKGFGAVAP